MLCADIIYFITMTFLYGASNSWHLFVTDSQETLTPLCSIGTPFLSGLGYPIHLPRNFMIFLSLFRKIVGNDMNNEKVSYFKIQK
jgi:hypothetical protein